MRQLHLVQLYPQEMNIYGDTGNLLVLQRRLQWRGIDFRASLVGIGDKLPKDADLIIGGGGQDAGQQLVETDLAAKAAELKAMGEAGVVMLMICGMYQLFGDAFITADNETIRGAGILPLFTQAGNERLIGNIVVDSDFGELVGYENHSGRTYIEEPARAFAKVVKGAGNNGEDGQEGVRLHNIFGSYMHGPILSKNPQLADGLLGLAADRKSIKLATLDDTLEKQAALIASKRPR